MGENLCSCESKLDLIGDVVHSHSNEIKELQGLIVNEWVPWSGECVKRVSALQERVEGHGRLLLDLNERLENVETVENGRWFGKLCRICMVGAGLYFGYKLWNQMDERITSLETKEACEVLQNKVYSEPQKVVDMPEKQK